MIGTTDEGLVLGRPEDKYVKIPAVIQATRIGYSYVSLHGLEPGIGYDPDTNIFFDSFRDGLSRINGAEVSDDDARRLVGEIRRLLDADDLGKAFYEKLLNGIDGYRLLDFKNMLNNKFEVVTELPYASGDDSFRPDITFLVNGMPLGFMEAKRQNNKDGIIAERERMHSRFRNPIYKRFVNITQVMAFSNNQEYDDDDRHGIQGSYYASSAYGDLAFNHFREEHPAEMLSIVADRDLVVEETVLRDNNLATYFGTAEYESSIDPDTPANRFVTSIFAPERLLFLIQYGICYVEKSGEGGIKLIQKHVMRYPQLFATKAIDAALSAGETKGVVWHTQGSGKTALAFYLSRYLRDWYQNQGRIARFYFIVDRLDLAQQAASEFRSRGAIVNIVNSRQEFNQSLERASEGTDRAAANNPPVITVVNIQKFDDESRAKDYDYSLNVQRVYFIDEAHRDYKLGGTFLANLMSSDRDAVKIALTGTPLLETRRGNATKQIFGEYFHKYFYNQSIADGYTLKLLREDIKTEFKLRMQEAMRDLQEIKGMVDIKEVFTNRVYYEPLVDYIVNDYTASQIALDDSSIGAMIVASSAEQARRIHAYLSQLDQDISCELILHDEGTKETRKAITDNFRRDDSDIDILVVYNMLLTGFDAHRLKKLYLLRRIEAHNLLQALTRVNRPYKDIAHGYVVDFADITEEYDKTNRAYLAELNEELGDAAGEYSSLFEDTETVEKELATIRDILFEYTTDNVVDFQNELGLINDKAELYRIRNALARYKDLRNVAQMHGYEWLYVKFDVTRAREMQREVELRIQAINNKEALAMKDMSTGAINLLLQNMRFTFRNVGEEELAIADEFDDKLRKTYEAFAHTMDPKDPEYVNLLEELKKKFRDRNIEEMTSADMVKSIDELDDIRARVEALNRRDAALAKKYNGDQKYVRIHKTALRTPPPITESPSVLNTVLTSVKGDVDGALLSNHNLLGNRSYFSKKVGRALLLACKAAGVTCTPAQIETIVDSITTEYSDERGKAA